MATDRTIRTLRNRGRGVAVISVLLLLAAAVVTSRARAEEGVVAYANAPTAQIRAARSALDEAISGAAQRANAALTEELRVQLQNRIRNRVRFASLSNPSRG